jgi:hypothetical protein
MLPKFDGLARRINAPLLITNRVGISWIAPPTEGGCIIYSAKGEVLTRANKEAEEEILTHKLEI